jgi:hypothetical protein
VNLGCEAKYDIPARVSSCRLTDERKQQRTKYNYLCMVLPCLGWIRGYNVKEHLLVS